MRRLLVAGLLAALFLTPTGASPAAAAAGEPSTHALLESWEVSGFNSMDAALIVLGRNLHRINLTYCTFKKDLDGDVDSEDLRVASIFRSKDMLVLKPLYRYTDEGLSSTSYTPADAGYYRLTLYWGRDGSKLVEGAIGGQRMYLQFRSSPAGGIGPDALTQEARDSLSDATTLDGEPASFYRDAANLTGTLDAARLPENLYARTLLTIDPPGIGTALLIRFNTVNRARIDTEGVGYFNGGTQNSGADVAESVVAADATTLEPGDVLVIDPKAPRRFARSSAAESRLVAGVYATKPGVLLRNGDVSEGIPEDEVPLAVVGIVPTKVCDEGGPIAIGDLLVTASKPGYAKKAPEEPKAGTVLGKSLGALDKGSGTVEVLLTAR